MTLKKTLVACRSVPMSVVIDETWARTNMPRLSSWAPRGSSPKFRTANGRLRPSWPRCRLCLFDGLINRERFLAYVEQFPNDSLSFTSSTGGTVRHAIDAGTKSVGFKPNR
jgi:hypothetical protein